MVELNYGLGLSSQQVCKVGTDKGTLMVYFVGKNRLNENRRRSSTLIAHHSR